MAKSVIMNNFEKSTYYESKIVDSTYREKFVELPRIISEWVGEYFPIEGKDVLDFGCGEATTALGLLLQSKPRRVVGVEIQDEYLRCLPLARQQLGLDFLPDNLNLFKVNPGEMHDPSDKFDLIYSWSVFEHVEQKYIASIFENLYLMLKPGGLFFMQIAPLYFSAEGSHLKPWIPEPWAHLRHQHNVFEELLKAGCPSETERETLWSVYTTLNKVTANQMVKFAKNVGFEILRDYRTTNQPAVPNDILEIYSQEILDTDQVVLLCRRNK
jgi:2-polyprenyl-3-methyl-5-hydroxy-6-metoxy-1,4-benzoquinol methylase